jgi:D-amino-acid dehydrogenase
MRVIVLGAGVAGITSAYFLAQDGHEVTLVDKNAGLALETSYANGGQLSYSYVAPLASPGVLPKIPPWLFRRDSPLRFEPALDPHQWRWCIEFLAACSQSQADLTTRRLLALSFYSRRLMHTLVADEKLDFDYVRNGKLVVHTRRDSFESAKRLLDYQASLGCEQHALDARACVDLEPALEHIGPRLAGGIYTPSEDAGDCYRFCIGLAAAIEARHPGRLRLRLNTEVNRILRWKNRIVGLETTDGVIEADSYVLALGNMSPWLVRPLGIRLPIYPLKGYSLTLPVSADCLAPRISITDYQRKVVYAPLGDELRVAGMADLAGYNARIDETRLDTLIDEVKAVFPRASDFSHLRPWCGLRPATPKGTPLMGATPYPNLYLNVGHGALGFTLSMGSARIVADIISGRVPEIPMDGFSL